LRRGQTRPDASPGPIRPGRALAGAVLAIAVCVTGCGRAPPPAATGVLPVRAIGGLRDDLRTGTLEFRAEVGFAGVEPEPGWIVELVEQAGKQVGVHDGFLDRIHASLRGRTPPVWPRNRGSS